MPATQKITLGNGGALINISKAIIPLSECVSNSKIGCVTGVSSVLHDRAAFRALKET